MQQAKLKKAAKERQKKDLAKWKEEAAQEHAKFVEEEAARREKEENERIERCAPPHCARRPAHVRSMLRATVSTPAAAQGQ